jgi:hypothetical protein
MAAFIKNSPGRFFLVLFLFTFSFYCFLSASSPFVEGRPPLIADEGESKVWSVSLQAGENYFSLPLIPYGVTWQELFGRKFSSLEEIACYDPFVSGDEVWQRFYPDRPGVSTEDKPVSLVFRVIAKESVTLWFEGQRFTAEIDKYASLGSRLKVGSGWNFLGGAFDTALSKAEFEEILSVQNFNYDRDYLFIWDLFLQKWTKINSAYSYSNVQPGAVLMASFSSDGGKDPYNPSIDRINESDNAGASMAHLSYLARNHSGFKELGEKGSDFDAGEFKISDYTYEEDSDGRKIEGSAWINLPQGLLGFTDLSPRVRAKIDYADSGNQILKINILGVSELRVGPGTETERQLSEIKELFVTADGTFYGEGKLLSESVTEGVSDKMDLPVRLIWNNKWPSINPDSSIGVSNIDELEKDLRPVMEIEYVISEKTMAALRWWKLNEDAPVKGIDSWKLYFHSGYEGLIKFAQNIPADKGVGIKNSIDVSLSSHKGETDSSDPIPHFIGKDLIKAYSARSYVFKGLVSEQDPADLYAYKTGLITIELSDNWNCNIYDETVDFEVKASDKFSFHMLYTLDGGSAGVSREEGNRSVFKASVSPALILDGHDFNIGDLLVKKAVLSLQARGELNYSISRDENGPMGVKRILNRISFGTAFGSTTPMDWKQVLGNNDGTRGWTSFNESSLGIGCSGLLEMSLSESGDKNLVIFGHVDKDWTYVAGPTIAEDKVETVLSVGGLVAFSAIASDDEDLPLPVVANAAVSFEYKKNSEKTLPATDRTISVMAKFNPPESWGMAMEKPSIDGIYTHRKRTFHATENGPLNSVRHEFTLMSNFTFSYGAENEFEMPGGDGKKIPRSENGLAIDTFTFSKEKKNFQNTLLSYSDLALSFSGSAVQNRWNSTLEAYETKVAALTAFGGGKWLPSLTKGQNLANLDYLLMLDLNHNIVEDTFRFSKLLVSRKDLKWGFGFKFDIRTKPEYPWGSFSVMPVAADKQNWFVTVDFNNFQLADHFTLKSAFAKIGKTNGQWDNAFGGILAFPDIAPVNEMNLEIGAMIALASKKVTLFSNMSTSNPQIGGSNFGMSFKNITGTYDWGIKKLSVSTDWDIFCEWLKPERVDSDGQGDGETRPIGFKVAFTKEFSKANSGSGSSGQSGNSGQAATGTQSGSAGSSNTTTGTNYKNSSWTFGAVATEIFERPFDSHKPMEEGGGFSLDSLELKYMTGMWNWAGKATIYTPQVWRDTLSGSTVGVAIPEKATAELRSYEGAKKFEINTVFSETVGLKIGELMTLGVDSFRWRKASPWRGEAGATLQAGSRNRVEGILGRNPISNAFEFKSKPDQAPLEVELGSLELKISEFILSFAPAAYPGGPLTFQIAGSVEVESDDIGSMKGKIALTVGTDGVVGISLTECVGLNAGPIEDPNFSITARKVMISGVKKWEIVMSVGMTFVVPEEIPLIGGKEIQGSFSGSYPNGDFRFAAATNLPAVPILGDMGGLKFSALAISRTTDGSGKKQWGVEALAQMTFDKPINTFFGSPSDVPFSLPECRVSYVNGQIAVDANIKNPPGFQADMDLGKLGEAEIALTRLYFSSAPTFGAQGSFKMTGSLEFEVDFFLDYNPTTNACSFMLEFDEALQFGVPGVFNMSLKKAGYRAIVLGMMGIEATFSFEIGNMFFGFGIMVDNLLWMSPSVVPPVGFPFFDELALKVSLLGFSAGGSVSLPKPRVPSVSFFLNFFKNIKAAFQGGCWLDLSTFLQENRDEVERVFLGPGVGNAFLLLPYLLKDALPDLEVVEEEIVFIGKLKRLRLPLMDKIYYMKDIAQAAGIDWVEALVDLLKTTKNLIDAASDPKKIIALIPEDYRAGRFGFSVQGFASMEIGYAFVDDQIVYATEHVDGVKEFSRFNRLATYVEETYPRLKDIASAAAAPVTTSFTHKDREGETFKGDVKDTFVNLKSTIEEAVRIREEVALGSGDFNEMAAFRKHMNYLIENDAVFTNDKGLANDRLIARLDSKKEAWIKLHGVSMPLTFKNETGTKTYFDGTLPFYSTYSAVLSKTGESLASTEDAAGQGKGETGDLLKHESKEREQKAKNLSEEEQKKLGEAADARDYYAQKVSEVGTCEKKRDELKVEIATVRRTLDEAKVAQEISLQKEFEEGYQALAMKAKASSKIQNVLGYMVAQQNLKKDFDQRMAGILSEYQEQLKVQVEPLQKRLNEADNNLVKARKEAASALSTADRIAAEAAGLTDKRKDAERLYDALNEYMGTLSKIVVTNHVEMKNGKLVLVFDASLRDLVSDQVIYRQDIEDQWIFDSAKQGIPEGGVALPGVFNPTLALLGWQISHPLDFKGWGTSLFTDYGTMKIEAPLTVITYQFKGSKLNKLRDALDYLGRLPVFDYDSTPFLLSNYFWMNLLQNNPPVKRQTVKGNAIRVLYAKNEVRSQARVEQLSQTNADGGATTKGDVAAESNEGDDDDDEEDSSMEVFLRLEDLRYKEEASDGDVQDNIRMSVRSDISRFYKEGGRLIAEPFRLSIGSLDPADKVEQTIDRLVILDGSPDLTERLIQSREGSKNSRSKSLFEMYEEWGITPRGEELRLERVTVELNDGYLQTYVRPRFVSIINRMHGGEMLRLQDGDGEQIERLMENGPYNDPSTFPTKEGTYFVECRGFAGATRVNTDSDESLIGFFDADILLRELDLASPKNLIMGDIWQGSVMENHVEARSDGIWQGGIVVPNSPAPGGVEKFLKTGEKLLFTLKTPSNKPIKITRKFNGDVEIMVERVAGKWESCFLERDGDEHITGSLKYPTGEVIPGGFFIDGMLTLGSASSLGGSIDFNGSITNDGNFHFEGGCSIYILGKTLAEGRFIIDRRDGLYIMGKLDAGVAKVFIEGRLSKNDFSLIGTLDVRIGGLLGVKATISVTPRAFEMRGSVYLAGKKIFYGIIRVTGSSFTFHWSASCGRVGASADVKFTSNKDSSGRCTSWALYIGGKAWVKLWWPFGKHSLSFGFGLDSDGNFKVYFWKVYIKINIVRFNVDWGWD